METSSPRIISQDTDTIAAKAQASAQKLKNDEVVARLRKAIQRRDKANMRMHRFLPDSLTWERERAQHERNTAIMNALLAVLAQR